MYPKQYLHIVDESDMLLQYSVIWADSQLADELQWSPGHSPESSKR